VHFPLAAASKGICMTPQATTLYPFIPSGPDFATSLEF
jgi:hypothetical protein